MKVNVACDKNRCAYNLKGKCAADDIELGGHQTILNRDAHTSGQYLTCYTFEAVRIRHDADSETIEPDAD